MRVLKYLTAFLLLIGVAACSDSGSSNEEQPPTVPDLQSVTPETEFFDSGNSAAGETGANPYDNATNIVEGTVEPLFGMAETVAFPFIQQAQSVSPSLNDGVWEWQVSYSAQGQTLEIRLTASVNESNNDVSWNLYLTSSGTEGPNFTDYRFMSGTSQQDGSQGSWKIYPYDPTATTEAFYDFSWTKSGDNNLTATIVIDSPSTTDSFTLDYEENGAEHTLIITDSTGSLNVEIFWNSDTNAGYIIQSGTKTCWDSNYQQTAC